MNTNLNKLVAAMNGDKATLKALAKGEDSVLRTACIANGVHPDYQNGKTLLPMYRRALDKLTK